MGVDSFDLLFICLGERFVHRIGDLIYICVLVLGTLNLLIFERVNISLTFCYWVFVKYGDNSKVPFCYFRFSLAFCYGIQCPCSFPKNGKQSIIQYERHTLILFVSCNIFLFHVMFYCLIYYYSFHALFIIRVP